jgi:hypothetical protein
MPKVLAVATFFSVSIAAWAQFTDPSTLFMGFGAGTACATGTAAGCSIDPSQSKNTNSNKVVDIFQNQGGANPLQNPLLLILGLPNTSTTSYNQTSIWAQTSTAILGGGLAGGGGVTSYNPYSGSATGGTADNGYDAVKNTYSLKNPSPGTAYFGNMSSGEIYSFLTLTQPVDNSNSFVNWAGADATINGITPSSFAIFVYALNSLPNNDVLDAKGLVNVIFNNSLPIGSYAVGYGEQGTHLYATPFTQSGLMTGGSGTVQGTVPEPTSILLLGTILLIIGKVFTKRHRRV